LGKEDEVKIGNIDRARHEDLLPSKRARELEVMVVGCGAIGSWSAVLLAKMGVRKFVLIDFDRVEDVNVSVQAFGAMAIGESKVEALKKTLMRDMELKDREVVTIEERWMEEMGKKCDVCVASMDNLGGRQEVWEGMKDKAGLFVDPRMGAQFLEVHAVGREDEKGREEYGKVIYPKDESFTPEPCAARAVVYTAAIAGGAVANMVRQWVMGEKGRQRIFMYDIVQGSAWTIDPDKMEDMEGRMVGCL